MESTDIFKLGLDDIYNKVTNKDSELARTMVTIIDKVRHGSRIGLYYKWDNTIILEVVRYRIEIIIENVLFSYECRIKIGESFRKFEGLKNRALLAFMYKRLRNIVEECNKNEFQESIFKL